MSSIPTIHSLHQEKSTKDNLKNDIFTVVLNKCIEKIVYTNRHTDKTFVIFEVPKILIGQPSYDMNSCIIFIMNQLAKSQYIVEFIEPFYLYIDWGTKSRDSKESSNGKLKRQTEVLLKRFPETSKIEFVYEDSLKKDSSKKAKKNARKQ
jgi:hypothetical protein